MVAGDRDASHLELVLEDALGPGARNMFDTSCSFLPVEAIGARCPDGIGGTSRSLAAWKVSGIDRTTKLLVVP